MSDMMQTVFDKVATHLLAQDKKAVDPVTNVCVYRSPDGLKCAVGCLIQAYKPEMEGITVSYLVEANPLLLGFEVTPKLMGLVLDLQQVHDHYPVKFWKRTLTGVALKHRLEVKF